MTVETASIIQMAKRIGWYEGRTNLRSEILKVVDKSIALNEANEEQLRDTLRGVMEVLLASIDAEVKLSDE